jgi:hypothetical protein
MKGNVFLGLFLVVAGVLTITTAVRGNAAVLRKLVLGGE